MMTISPATRRLLRLVLFVALLAVSLVAAAFANADQTGAEQVALGALVILMLATIYIG